MEYIVRKMNENDIRDVQQVAKTSWNHTYQGIIPEAIQERFLNSAYSSDMLNRRLIRLWVLPTSRK